MSAWREGRYLGTGTEQQSGLTLEIVEALIASRDEDALASLLLELLAASVAANDTDAQEHIGGFAGKTIAKDAKSERLGFWRHTLRRCDTDAALHSYILKSFRNYCRKERCKQSREYDALYAIVNRALQGAHQNTAFAGTICQALVPRSRNKEDKLYGLTVWQQTVEQLGLFDGHWDQVQTRDDEGLIDQTQFSQTAKNKYERDDIIAACVTLLKLAGKYCRANTLSTGISRFWVDCARLAVGEMHDLDIAHIDPGGNQIHADPVLQDEWVLIDVHDLAESFLHGNFEKRELTVLFHRVIGDEDDQKTLHELAADLGVSHVTIRNIEQRATNSLKYWLAQADIDERRDFCRVLPQIVKNLLERCL